MLRRVLAATAIAFTGCAASRLECNVHGGPTWYQAQSERFVARSNVEPETLRAQITLLEQLLTGIESVVGAQATYPRPIGVILVERDELASFGADPLNHDPEQPVFAEVTRFGEPHPWAHHLAHDALASALPGLSLWLREGLASYVQTATFSGVQELAVGVGLAHYQYAVLSDRPLRVEELWQWGKGEEPLRVARLHGYAWGIVDHLMKNERVRMTQVFAAVRNGEECERAFNRVFPKFERRELPDAVERMSGALFVAVGVALPPPPPEPTLRPLTPGEVHLARAEVFEHASRLRPRERERARDEELELARELADLPAPEMVAQPATPADPANEAGDGAPSGTATEPVPRAESTAGAHLSASPAARTEPADPPPPLVSAPLVEAAPTPGPAASPRAAELPQPIAPKDWTHDALVWAVERPIDAEQLIDGAPPVMDILGLRRTWVAAAVLGDCARLSRVRVQQVRRFEASHPAETAQMNRWHEVLCSAAAPPRDFTCAAGELGFPEDVLEVLLGDRTRRLGALTAAVSSVETIAGDVVGTLALTVRSDGRAEVSQVTLEPAMPTLTRAFSRAYERLAFPRPCGGDVAYQVPVSFRRAPGR